MKVVAISGSPRRSGNTEKLIEHTLKSISEENINTELISLAGLDIRPCTACLACKEGEQCSIDDDLMPIYKKMKASDGIILASPVYFGSCTAVLKSLMERTGYIARYNGAPFKGKVGGPLVVARRAGHNFTLSQIDFWFHIMEIVEPGSTYWNIAFGRDRGDVSSDEEGLKTAWNFGKNMAFVIKKLDG
jgi:multimeric flavodoxin WrbA